LRIAQLIPSLLPTGPVSVALDLTALFREQGHEVDLFYFDDLEGAADLKAQKLKWRGSKHWMDYDIIHSHGIRPDLYVRMNRWQMPKTVTTIHNYVFEDLKHAYNGLVSKVFGRIWCWAWLKHDARVVLSRHMKAYYSSFMGGKSFNVIANTRLIDRKSITKETSQIKAFARNRKVIGAVAHVTTRKALHQVIEFLYEDEDWVFVLVGDGDLQPLIELAKKQGVSDRCLFMGYQEKGWQYIPDFDVYVIPSVSEGFPLALIETVQMHVPVVASAIDVFKEIFNDNEVSFFQLNNVESLRKAVHLADEKQEMFVKNAELRFQAEYAPDKISKKYLELFRSLK
jgi:glycosyltransferase involved in cell wall biosynthesis